MKRVYLLLAGAALIYFAFLTRTYYWDGVIFSLDIEGFQKNLLPAFALFQPNHLVYNAVGYAFCIAALNIWPAVRAITVLQVLSVLASIGGALLIYLIAKSLLSRKAALFACFLFAIGATWWKFSTDADAYTLAVCLLLLGTFLLLRNEPNFLGAAICHSGAMLLHELAVFFYVPVLSWILTDQHHSTRRRLLTAAAYCAGTVVLVGGAYQATYSTIINHNLYPTLKSWITSYAADSNFSRSAGDLFVRYPLSYLKLFAGGKLSLIRQFFSVWVLIPIALSAVFVVLAIRAWRRRGDERNVDRHFLIFLWAWVIGYAAFFAMWDPGSAFHKLFVWPPIVLLIAIYARLHLRAATWFAAALAAWNFGAFIYPHSRLEADPVLVLARQIDRQLPRNATIYYRFADVDDWYLEYFAPGRQWMPLPVDPNKRGPVCLETTALSGFRGAIDPAMKWDLVNSAHNVRLECLASK